MFSISFLPTFDRSQVNNIQPGEIIIGDFKELFFSSLSYWNQEQYLQQWKEGIARICNGKINSAAIVDMYDPNSQNIIQWWVFRCYKDIVSVRNEIILLDRLKQPLIEKEIYECIEEKPKINKKGQKISEWKLDISDFHDFYSKISN